MEQENELELLTAALTELAGATLRGAGETAALPAEAATLVRDTLVAETLDAEEEKVLEEWRTSSADVFELLNQLVAGRARKALFLATRTVSESATAQIPTLLVARDPGLDEPTRIGGADTVFDAGDGPTLVLAERAAFQELSGDATLRQGHDVVDVGSLNAVAECLGKALPADLAPLFQPAKKDLTGEVLSAKYRIKRKLGSGGFGTVYEAVDEILGARVAIKILNPNAARSKDAFQRFLEEAQLLTNLDHENVVRWITFDRTEAGLHYFVMEYLQGEELADILDREERLPAKRVQSILLQVLAALRAAHDLPGGGSLLHLDLKPQNVFLLPPSAPGGPERVKVFDFGIGQHVGAVVRRVEHTGLLGVDDEAADLEQSLATRVTPEDQSPAERRGEIQRARGGTLFYASPEQCTHLAGHRDIVALDGRSDLYSLGVMAFKMLTGEYPFKTPKSARQAIRNHLEVEPRRVGSLGVRVPRQLAHFVDRCLRKDRDERWASTEEAYAYLEALVHPPAWKLAVKVAAPLVLLSAVLFFFFSATVTPAFDLFVSDRSLEQDALYLGPHRQQVELELRGYDLAELAQPVLRLVEDRGNDEDALRWTSWLGGNRFALEAPPDSTGLQSWVYAQILGPDGEVVAETEDPFQLGYLPDDACEILGVGVPGLAEKSLLDPRGKYLEIRLRGQAEHVDEVRVSTNEADGSAKELTAERAPSSTEESPVFRVGLDEFALPAVGQVGFTIQLTDKAGGPDAEIWQQRVDSRPLELSAVLRDCTPVESRFIVTPGERRLAVALNRRAKITIEMLDSLGEPLAPAAAPEEPAESLDLVLLFPQETEYDGKIVVRADDNFAVLHKDFERGVSRQEILFKFSPHPVQITASTYKGTLDAERPTFVNTDTLAVDLRRDSQVPVIVRAWIDAEEHEEELIANPEGRLSLDLPHDGVFELELKAFRSLGSSVAETHEWELRSRVVRDTTAPTLTIQGAADLVVGDDPGAEEPRVRIVVGDEPYSDELETPLRLSYTVVRSTAAGGILESTSDTLADPTEQLGLSSLSGSVSGDGVYRLDIQGADEAGNPVQSVRPFEWTVAREGPGVETSWPVTTRTWEATEGEDGFQVLASASDPNGVATVTCRMMAGDREFPKEKELEPTGKLNEYKADFLLDHTWSEARVDLVVTATDQQGVATTRTFEGFALPDIPHRFPAAIDVTRVDDSGARMQVASMRLIESNDAPYIFQGQGDDAENKLFAEHGLDPFSSKRRKRSQRITVGEGAIQAYYLDETEVSVEQFRAFLDAPSGHADAKNWAGAPRPRSTEELRSLLADRAPDLPVTGIGVDEARAYAHWIGKRLPTWLEWEFAVRGKHHKPYSAAPIEAEASGWPRPEDFNYRNPTGSAWPVEGRGSDVTEAGVRNLCSNVAEWVEYEQRICAAGASFANSRCDFGVVWPNAPEEGDPTVGFRCALFAADADRIRSDGTSAIRITASD